MKKLGYVAALMSALVACQVEGVKTTSENRTAKDGIETNHTTEKKITAEKSDNMPVKQTEHYDNGVSISWMQRGTGGALKKGDVIAIDYKVTLKDGSVVDGNHLLNRPSLPFMVGFQMQTKGWDFAMSKLKVGDFVRIKIPADLARGKEGIKGLIPPNADNYLSLRIVEKVKPSKVIDGVKVWLLEENKKNTSLFGDKNSITFHSMISSESHPMYYNSMRNNQPYNLRMTDQGIVPGLKKALKNAKKADRMFVYIPAKEAYGALGLEQFVGPNEALFYNIIVMDVTQK